MKFKKNHLKAIISFPLLAFTAALPISSYIANANYNNQIKKDNESREANKKAGESGQTTPSLTLDLNKQVNSQYTANKFYVQNDMPSITNANGPILLGDEGRSIAAYDWYGNPSWFLNLNSDNIQEQGKKDVSSNATDQTPAKPKYDAQASYYKYSNALSTQIPWDKVGKKIVDVAYLASRDFLYVLTDTSYLFLIQSTTGTINSVKELGHSINKISLIDFNNSLIGWDSRQNDQPVYNIDTQKLSTSVMMQNSATGINHKYIFDILPLDVGYNILISSENNIASKSTKEAINLKATFIQDNGNKFNKSDNEDLNNKEKTITLDSTLTKDIYTTTLKRNGTNILIVGNSIFNISLDKSAMENTVFDELNKEEAPKGTSKINLDKINSAFVDESNLVYLKDNSDNIYQISLDNKVTQSIKINTSGGTNTIFTGDNVKTARIYPVLKNSSNQVALKGTGYIASPNNFTATGFMNGSVLGQNFTNTIKKPTFSIPKNYATSAPSSFTNENITVASTANGFDKYNTEFYADDISGELYVKTRLMVTSWYDKTLNATTSSYVIGKWNCAKIEIVTRWATQQQFNGIAGGLFAKRSPDQISDADVTKYADQILNLPSVVTSSDFKEVKIIVVARKPNENSVGKITLQATVKYKNKKGTIVSYFMNNKEFNVKKAADTYKFQFYGGEVDDTSENKQVDINTLGASFTTFRNTLPTLVDPSSDNLQAFIQIEDKYPTDTRRVITIVNPNDTTGQMTVKVHYNNLEASTNSTFYITYTGMATLASNQVNFKGDKIADEKVPVYDGQNVFGKDEIKDITTIPEYKGYNEKLATDIQANQLNLAYQSNLSLMGFNPEVSIEKDPNNNGNISSHDAEYGSINVVLDYTNSKSELLGINLPKEYWNNFGLTNGIVKQRYIGFLPIGATYGVELKSYNSPEVQNVVQNNNVNADIAPTQLISTLDIRGYNTEGQTPNITVQNFSWNGENLTFAVHAQSTKYNTVTTDKTFTISWSPKFAAIRQRNLIISSTTSILGVALVSAAVTFYILRRNKIRRFMK